MIRLFTHEFETPIARHGVGRTRIIWYTVIFLPADVASTLPLKVHPRLRVRAEINDVPIDGAWLPSGDGRWYFIVSRQTLRLLEAKVGSKVEMRFLIDDQDRVDVPAELAQALARRPALSKTWEQATPGRRRGLSYLVRSARSSAARDARIKAVLEELSETRSPSRGKRARRPTSAPAKRAKR